MDPKDLNQAADLYASDSEAEEPDFNDVAEEPGTGVRKKPGKKRGPAPAFGPSKAHRAKGGGHKDDLLSRTQPLPDWMNDRSLLPKKPPGK